jgi:hypothetical protein
MKLGDRERNTIIVVAVLLAFALLLALVLN